jgi:adenylate cyclase
MSQESMLETLRTKPLVPTAELGVLFADIAGSTKLYDTLGDGDAKAMIDEALLGMRAVTERNKGRVVKTIGDELMCVFPTADAVFLAATDMQIKVDSLRIVSGVKRAIRVGFHFGPVIEEGTDVFGDTVNVAARMAGVAKGGQIITTRETVLAASAHLRAGTRDIAALAVKGKGEEVAVCEVIWKDGGDLTMMTGAGTAPVAPPVTASLLLRFGSKTLMLDHKADGATLGREATCTIVVADPKASRVHAKIERRRDKFFLMDQSTNGTFVTFTGEPELSLRREEAMLRGKGTIVFGHSATEGTNDSVSFEVGR